MSRPFFWKYPPATPMNSGVIVKEVNGRKLKNVNGTGVTGAFSVAPGVALGAASVGAQDVSSDVPAAPSARVPRERARKFLRLNAAEPFPRLEDNSDSFVGLRGLPKRPRCSAVE